MERHELLVAVCAGANSCVRPEVMMEVHRLGRRCEKRGERLDLLLLSHADLSASISVALRALHARPQARVLLFLGPDVCVAAGDAVRMCDAGPDLPLVSALVASPVAGGDALRVAAGLQEAVRSGRIDEEAAPHYMVDFPTIPLAPVAEAVSDASDGEELGVVCDTFSAPLFAMRRDALLALSPGAAAPSASAWIPALFAPTGSAAGVGVGVAAFFERTRAARLDHLLLLDAHASVGGSGAPSFLEFYTALLA